MHRTALVTVFAVLALVGATAALAAPRSVTVTVRTTPVGKVLAAANGHTLYLFTADKSASSSCYGSCAKIWTPLLVTGKPTAGAGVKATLLKTVKRHDGKLQVTYAGHPLYLFTSDSKAGQASGVEISSFGGEWFAVSTAGKKVEKPASSGGSGSGSGSGGGGGTTTDTGGGGYGY